MAPNLPYRLRFVLGAALVAALSFVATGCGLFLGIEDVKEIQPTGGAGTGGTAGTGGQGGVTSSGGAGGTGGTMCQPETCDSRGWQCGTGDNGCNEPLNCGLCMTGEGCNNETHSCAPLPPECQNLGWQCGSGMDMGMPVEC